MTNAMPWRAAIGKELRALFPAWTAFAIALVVSIAFSGTWSWLIFILGAVVLGALSIGHEYLHGTLSPWLALPVSRWQLVAAKLAALTPLLVSLAILATLGLIAANGFPARAFLRLELTRLACRSSTGSSSRPGSRWSRAVRSAVSCSRWRSQSSSAWRCCSEPLDVCPALLLDRDAAVRGGWRSAGWRTFMRLEALDTHRDVESAEALRQRGARSRRLAHLVRSGRCSRKNSGFSR